MMRLSGTSSQGEQNYTQVTFKAHAPVGHGETIRVVGDIPALGSWNVENGEELETSAETYPTWHSSTPIPLQTGKPVRYKYAIFSGGKFNRWESFDSIRTFIPRPDPTLNTEELSDTDGEVLNQFTVEDIVEISQPNIVKAHTTQGEHAYQQDEVSSLNKQTFAKGQGKAVSNKPSVSFETKASRPRKYSFRKSDLSSKSFGKSHSSTVESEIEEIDGVLIICYYLPLIINRTKVGASNFKWSIAWNENSLLSRKAYTRADNKRVYFIGCPPLPDHEISKEDREELVNILLRRFNSIPVFIERDLHELHWMGFCEGKLRKHMYNIIDVYGPLPQPWLEDAWHAYSTVNRLFADKIVEVFNEGDIVWIHGYELLILPSFLARRLQSRTMEVGLFLHCPFPSSEIFRTIWVRDELLRGMLNADHIGFHLYEYARHFLTCCRRILRLHYTNEGGNLSVDNQGRKVAVSVCHAGIEPEFIRHRLHHEDVPKIIDSILNSTGDISEKIVVVALDRLEVLRGVYMKLLAWQKLLTERVELRCKLCLIQVLTCSDDERKFAGKSVELMEIENEVETCRKDILWLAGKINKICSNESEKVVHIIERQRLSILDRMALWSIGKILMVTPLREGLNLHGFEFSVVHDELKKLNNKLGKFSQTSTIISSEFSAMSRVLTGSLRVNPWRIDEVVATLLEAITMPNDERERREKVDLDYVSKHTFAGWTERVVADVKKARNIANLAGFGLGHGYRSVGFHPGFTRIDFEKIVEVYKKSVKRLILLDYGGTTVPDEEYSLRSNSFGFSSSSENKGMPSKDMVKALRDLCADPRNFVFIVSGKEASEVENVFREIPGLGLTAEHGLYYSWPKKLRGKSKKQKLKSDKIIESLPSSSSTENEQEEHKSGEQDLVKDESFGARKWEQLSEMFDDSWMELSQAIIDVYVQRTSGTSVEQKGKSIQWQYKDADPEFGDLQASELQDHLEGVLKAFHVEVVTGKNYVEVRPLGIGKEKACEHIINKIWPPPKNPDFILCIGDDVADETMFEFLQTYNEYVDENTGELLRPEMSKSTDIFTAVVGKKPSSAQYYLDDERDVEALLRILAKVSNRLLFSRSLTDMRLLDSKLSKITSTTPEEQNLKELSLSSDKEKKNDRDEVMKPVSFSASVPVLSSYFNTLETPKATLEEFLEHIAEDDEGIYF